MPKRGLIMLIAYLLINSASADDTPLGKINIQLYGNIVDYSCYVAQGEESKTVQLGVWPTKQFRRAGSITQQMPFTLKLMGCPPGLASITFLGVAAAGNSELLALNSSSTATNIAVELRNNDHSRLPLDKASQEVPIDANGDATLRFYANYIALAGNPNPGTANADATFVINYE